MTKLFLVTLVTIFVTTNTIAHVAGSSHNRRHANGYYDDNPSHDDTFLDFILGASITSSFESISGTNDVDEYDRVISAAKSDAYRFLRSGTTSELLDEIFIEVKKQIEQSDEDSDLLSKKILALELIKK